MTPSYIARPTEQRADVPVIYPADDGDARAVDRADLSLESVEVRERLGGMVFEAAAVNERHRLGLGLLLGALHDPLIARPQHDHVHVHGSEVGYNVFDIVRRGHREELGGVFGEIGRAAEQSHRPLERGPGQEARFVEQQVERTASKRLSVIARLSKRLRERE